MTEHTQVMELRYTVAAPYRHRGTDRLTESEFVATIAMDLDWFTPDQAKRLVDLATGEGLLEREAGALAPTFDVGAVDPPEEFVPDESVLTRRSTFERLLDRITDAGIDKQEAVAGVNQLQADLAVTIEAAAVVFARRRGIDVDDLADDAIEALTPESS